MFVEEFGDFGICGNKLVGGIDENEVKEKLRGGSRVDFFNSSGAIGSRILQATDQERYHLLELSIPHPLHSESEY